MKLIRFEAKAEPGRPRSGVVHAGRIYETEDGQGVGVLEATQVRPLVPVAGTRSLRFYAADRQPEDPADEPTWEYGNVHALVGPSQIVPPAPGGSPMRLEAWIVAVVHGGGRLVPVEEADGLILGFSLMLTVGRSGAGGGAGRDLAAAFGPVLTTPDELDDHLFEDEPARAFELEATLRINGAERERGSTRDLPLSFARAIAAASSGAPVREGDLFALGPVGSAMVEAGDEATLAVQSLGALSVRIAEE